MKLYLVRHAEAVPEDIAGRDEDRWLTSRGREAARGLARLLRDQQVEPDAIVCSPLPRALQTAELLGAGLDFIGVVEVLPTLRPGVPPRLVAGELGARGTSIIVVGHEPSISELAAMLCAVPAFPSFRTAQACAIENGAPKFTSRADVMTTQALFL